VTDSLNVKVQRSPALTDDGQRRLAQVYTLLLEIANRSETAGRDDLDDQAPTAAGDIGLPGHGTAETVIAPAGRKGKPRRQRKPPEAQGRQPVNDDQGRHALEEGER
jgi:hypothetical protein